MKKGIITGSIVTVFGLLIALGPQFLFKVCPPATMTNGYPICHWTAQAEIGMGFLIAGLGMCLFVFSDLRAQQSLVIGTFLSSIIALSIPNVLIGGCDAMMVCRRVAFPILSTVCIVTLIGSVIYFIHVESKIKNKPSVA